MIMCDPEIGVATSWGGEHEKVGISKYLSVNFRSLKSLNAVIVYPNGVSPRWLGELYAS